MKATLRVQLVSEGPFVPGDTVQALIELLVHKDCECKKLDVRMLWRTSGAGTRIEEAVASTVLDAGSLKAGEQRVYPAEFVVPQGPFSFEGRLVEVGWFLDARADLPWAFDPSDEAGFVVVPGDALTGPLVREHTAVLEGAASRAVVGINLVVQSVGLVIVSLFASFFVFGAASISLGSGGGGCLFLIPFVAIPLGIVFIMARSLWKTAKPLLARMRLGEGRVSVPRTVVPGEEVEVELMLTPGKDQVVERLVYKLECEEIASSGTGTKRRTRREMVWTESEVVVVGETWRAGEAKRSKCTLRVPADARFSFSTRDNQVVWRAVVLVDIPGSMDAEFAGNFAVGPVLAAAK